LQKENEISKFEDKKIQSTLLDGEYEFLDADENVTINNISSKYGDQGISSSLAQSAH
jgi:hypothetical protein